MTTRTEFILVTIGDEDLLAECAVSGRFRPAITQADPMDCCPEESPECVVTRLLTTDMKHNLINLLADDALYEKVMQQCHEYLEDHQHDGPDPDEARERQTDAALSQF